MFFVIDIVVFVTVKTRNNIEIVNNYAVNESEACVSCPELTEALLHSVAWSSLCSLCISEMQST